MGAKRAQEAVALAVEAETLEDDVDAERRRNGAEAESLSDEVEAAPPGPGLETGSNGEVDPEAETLSNDGAISSVEVDPEAEPFSNEDAISHVGVSTGEGGPQGRTERPGRRHDAPVRFDPVEGARPAEAPVRFVPTHRQPLRFEDELPRRSVHPLRRTLPRQYTDWQGKYLVEGDPSERWRSCRVIDISTAGAGLLLFDAAAEEVEGREVIFAVQLKGEVRNARPVRGDNVRAGVQFVELTERERSYIDSLTVLNVRW